MMLFDGERDEAADGYKPSNDQEDCGQDIVQCTSEFHVANFDGHHDRCNQYEGTHDGVYNLAADVVLLAEALRDQHYKSSDEPAGPHPEPMLLVNRISQQL